ncbi:hypothetical protein BJX70DRAFT_395244 [Aspergillus crustosus]
MECAYDGPDRRSRDEWKARIEALEQRNAYLEQIVKDLNSKEAKEPVTQYLLREASSVGRPESSSTPTERQSFSQPEDLEYMFYAATTPNPLPSASETAYIQHPVARYTKFPEERITRSAIIAFFECAATLFYVTTLENAEQLCQRVYHTPNARVEDICELSALAAIGSHYQVEEIPDEARAVYFHLASSSLNEAIGANRVQGMRIFTCLLSALGLARAQIEEDVLKASLHEQEQEHFRRTLQTLVFLEGWLSYSLGYRNSFKKSGIDLIHYTSALNPAALDRSELKTGSIQVQMIKLAMVASEIQDDIRQHEHSDRSYVNELSAKLDAWYYSLSPDLHLAAPTKPDMTVTALQERAIYLMHILYIDLRLQLFCQLLKTSRGFAKDQSQVSLEELFGQVPGHIRDDHTAFSIQLSRTISLLYDNKSIMARCWIVIRSSFDATIVLFLGIIQKYLNAPANRDYAELLACIDSLSAVLHFCSRADIAAKYFEDMLDLIHTQFRDIGLGRRGAGKEPSGATMTVQYILEQRFPDEPALVRLTHHLLGLMSPGRCNVWV